MEANYDYYIIKKSVIFIQDVTIFLNKQLN